MESAKHFYAKDRKCWRGWLDDNHQRENAVWLVFDKGEKRKMSWQDNVQEALCFGWIDSRPSCYRNSKNLRFVGCFGFI